MTDNNLMNAGGFDILPNKYHSGEISQLNKIGKPEIRKHQNANNLIF